MNPTYRFLRYRLWPKLPASLTRPLVRRRRGPLFDAFRQVGAVFVHVPRAGGTSISSALYPMWIDHFTVREHEATLPPDLLGLPRFAVIRNPWERAVSAWSYARAGTGVDALFGMPHAEQYRVPQFETFERFVCEWLPSRDLAQLSPIFWPQSEFVVGASGNVELDHLGSLDRIEETEAWVGEILGARIRFPCMNASAHPHYRSFYTPALRDRVADIYRQDVSRFGHAF